MLKSGFTAIGLLATTCLILISLSGCHADGNTQLVNALVNGIANQGNNNNMQKESDRLTAEESQTITVIMNTLLPSMFGLFSNITSDDYKANFKEPCRFEVLMDLFKQLPPYFDIIAQKYPNQPDLIAYYSMQLASTFLVNNGSLTMECMYNMLSLQTRLNNFSLDIMDNPEKNPKLVGLFGIFMKPIMKMLKKNAMMKIIEHVDRYDKNDDRENVTIFHILNFLFIVFGTVAILSNILLIVLLRRSSIATRWVPESKKKQPQQTTRLDGRLLHPNAGLQHHTHSLRINRNLKGSHGSEHTIMVGSIDRKMGRMSGQHQEVSTKTSLLAESATNKNSRVLNQPQVQTPGRIATLQRKPKKPMTALQRKQHKLIEEYKLTKATNSQMYYYMRKRYKTRLCFVLIAICHSLYILINFIVMSQASLAAVSLKGLSQFNMACKFAFFLFPPTTAYNILHQFAIWLLVYAIRQHGLKIRRTRTFDPHADADHEIDLINSDSESSTSCNYAKPNTIMDISSHTEDEDTVSVSLTNNSNHLMISQSGTNCAMPQVTSNNSAVKFKSNQSIGNQNGGTNYHQIGMRNLNPVIPYSQPLVQMHQNHPYKVKPQGSGEGCLCQLFSRKRNNAMFAIILFIMLCVYDGQNLFLYSLAKLEGKTSTVYFCAFESAYADYYTLLTQFIVPMTNLCLFSLFPILLCTMQVLFDACFLVRVQREQMKRYEKLKEVIEWPLYCYYLVLIVSQVPFALHQIIDLCIGTIKFPFVFPLFIQLKFTSKVWLSVFEMISMFMACGADLYIWIFCDRQMSSLASNWLSKRIFCRTYKQKKLLTAAERDEITREKINKSSSSPISPSSNNSRTSEVDSSSSSSTYSSNDSNANFKKTKKQKNNIYTKPDNNTKSQIQQQQLLQAQAPSPTHQSYNTASTASSMASGSLPTSKKQLSPIIAAAADTAAATAKAAAAISASMAPMSIYDNFNSKNANEDLQENPTSPTFSNDTVPVPATTPLSAPPRIKMIDTDIDDIEDIDLDIGPNDQLTRLYEEKDHELPPPSFNTAVRKESASNSYRHQYQNEIDLEALVKR